MSEQLSSIDIHFVVEKKSKSTELLIGKIMKLLVALFMTSFVGIVGYMSVTYENIKVKKRHSGFRPHLFKSKVEIQLKGFFFHIIFVYYNSPRM